MMDSEAKILLLAILASLGGITFIVMILIFGFWTALSTTFGLFGQWLFHSNPFMYEDPTPSLLFGAFFVMEILIHAIWIVRAIWICRNSIPFVSNNESTI